MVRDQFTLLKDVPINYITLINAASNMTQSDLDDLFSETNREAMNLTLDQATAKFGRKESEEAALTEIQQMIDRNVFVGVPRDEVVPKEIVVPSELILTDKRDAEGNLIKIKGRMVAGGHRQSWEIYDDGITSPTVTTPGLFTSVAIAAHKRKYTCSYDVPGANLWASRKKQGAKPILFIWRGHYQIARPVTT